MTILAIESSCDETGAAILTKNGESMSILSNVISTSLGLHARTGGIIPEVAAREQVKFIMPVIQKALLDAFSYKLTTTPPPIDAIAVTHGPGLIGSLLVGIETAKTLSLLWNIPIIPVNHMYGHIYANFITQNEKLKEIELPAIALVVSGGHTDIIYLKSHSEIEHLGQTRDDAAGEAFDKIGRLLGLPYPAGPTISHLATKGDRSKFIFPRPMIGSPDFDFSFSGLKTSVLNTLKDQHLDFTDETFVKNHQQVLADICAGVEYAIVNVLTKKTVKAIEKYHPKSLLVGGGVAANTALKESLYNAVNDLRPAITLFIPDKSLCTDNAAMIAAHAFFLHPEKDPFPITANPNLSYI